MIAKYTKPQIKGKKVKLNQFFTVPKFSNPISDKVTNNVDYKFPELALVLYS